MEGLPGHLSRVAARWLRLHDHDVHPDRHPEQLHGRPGAGWCAGDRHLAVPSGGRARGRHHGRPLGAEAAADALDPLVLDLRVPQRLLHVLCHAVRVQGAVRHWHGRRVGGRDAAGPGALAGAIPGPRLRFATGRLVLGVHPLGADVPFRLPVGRESSGPAQRRAGVDTGLAGNVLDRGHPRAPRALDSLGCQRESGLAGPTAAPGGAASTGERDLPRRAASRGRPRTTTTCRCSGSSDPG